EDGGGRRSSCARWRPRPVHQDVSDAEGQRYAWDRGSRRRERLGTSCCTDLKHSLRALRRTPTSSGVSICILAVAIGASAAVFSVVDEVLLRPLPLDEPYGSPWEHCRARLPGSCFANVL